MNVNEYIVAAAHVARKLWRKSRCDAICCLMAGIIQLAITIGLEVL